MHLYLRENPRSLLLVTSSEDERRGSPPRGLVFRVANSRSSEKQVVVEFLAKEELLLFGVTKLTSRPVLGCLGARLLPPRCCTRTNTSVYRIDQRAERSVLFQSSTACC